LLRFVQRGNALKILVVDDHPLIRAAVRNVLTQLEADVEVHEAQDCPAALALVETHPDLTLVLLDLHLPGMGGLDALSILRERYPEIPAVVLSAADDRESVLQALDRGAMGFIPKSSSNAVMVSALRLVLSGGVYLPPEVLATHVAQAANTPAVSAPRPATSPATLGLTERQVQVLALMVQGKPNKLICRELGLAERTVKVHITAILKALKVSNRTQAVIAAGRMGIRLDGVKGCARGA
jgi:DNA-binding NarL/FixJ family response regulator